MLEIAEQRSEKRAHALALYENLVAKFDKGAEISPSVALSFLARVLFLLPFGSVLTHTVVSAKRDADQRWMQKLLRSGTLSDKVAATTLLIQQSPFYRLKVRLGPSSSSSLRL